MARLIVTLNNNVLSNHTVLEGHPVTIGRHSDNRIVIDHMAVSAHHARIFLDGQTLVVTDLGSRNGTMVNSEMITRSPLAHQDWISIGKHIIIVDLYESLSLETSVDQLIARSNAASDAEQTIMLNRQEVQSTGLNFDYLSFLSGRKEDFELTDRTVTIGKNTNADIRITGLRSFWAGSPSATITKRHDEYILIHKGGWILPRVNGTPIKKPHKLQNQDIISIGPVRFQIRFVRKPSL